MADLINPRAAQLAEVREVIAAKFPFAEIHTNDDANPATPFIVQMSWANGRIKKVVRADSYKMTVQQFLAKALPLIQAFQNNNVPTRHLQAAE